MSIFAISFTFLTLISSVSSQCAYTNTNDGLRPLRICLQANYPNIPFYSHWYGCDSGGVYYERFSSTDCSGSPYSSSYITTTETVNCDSATGSGHDCNYVILRVSADCSSDLGTYVDWAYIVGQCFNSYTNPSLMTCYSNSLESGTCGNSCSGGTCAVTDIEKLNDRCDVYGNFDEYVWLPYDCGNYYGDCCIDPTITTTRYYDTNRPTSQHLLMTTTFTTTTTTTESPAECTGATVCGLSWYSPWIVDIINGYYTETSRTLMYNYQQPGSYYLIYPCEVAGNYLPFELYVNVKNCWDKPEHNYNCLDSVTLTLLPRSKNPIIIEMSAFSKWKYTMNGKWEHFDIFFVTIDGEDMYDKLPLRNQRFSGNGVSGSYDISRIIELECYTDNICNQETTEVTVHIDGIGNWDCDPALKFAMLNNSYLMVDCPKCYTDNICGVLGHWDEENKMVTFPKKGQAVSKSIDYESPYDIDLQQFFESWEKTGNRRRLQSIDPLEWPEICDGYSDIKAEISIECRAVQDNDCCDEIWDICDTLQEVCEYDICACIESLNGTDYIGEVAIDYSDHSQLIDICMHNITEFPKSFNAICNAHFGWFANGEYSDEYNDGNELLALLILILIVPIAVGVYYFYRKRKEIVNEANNAIGKEQNIKQCNDDAKPLPNGWRIAYTNEGRKYYQNDITKQTAWNIPKTESGEGKVNEGDHISQNKITDDVIKQQTENEESEQKHNNDLDSEQEIENESDDYKNNDGNEERIKSKEKTLEECNVVNNKHSICVKFAADATQ